MTDNIPLPEMSVTEAIAVLDGEPVETRLERRSAGLSQTGRLAEPLRTDRPYPPYDKALMDGFAIKASEVDGDRREFEVVGDASAGTLVTGWQPGDAIRIATGAPLPPGTDAIVPIERCKVHHRPGIAPGEWIGLDRVTVQGDVNAGDAIAPEGSDRPAGATILPTGSRLTGGTATAATAVAHEAAVFRKPRVLVLCTGTEVVHDGQTPGRYQTRNSIGEPVRRLLAAMGCVTVRYRHTLPDVREILYREIERALQRKAIGGDALVLTGGMSMSRHDHIPSLLKSFGFEFRINKLRIRPGKPFVFAVLPAEKSNTGRPRYAFGLPGNPVSAFVCTLRLASRLLIRLGGGDPSKEMPLLPMPLAAPLEKANGPREFYQPCRLDEAGVHPLAWRGSADVFTLAQADALLVRPEQDPPHAAGELVKVLPIPR
ncbi:MAG: molybdopterin molybdotransferase MoeA [Planctomycetota bacterium]